MHVEKVQTILSYSMKYAYVIRHKAFRRFTPLKRKQQQQRQLPRKKNNATIF